MKNILVLGKRRRAFLFGVGIMVIVFVLLFFIGGIHIATPWIFFLGQTQVKSQEVPFDDFEEIFADQQFPQNFGIEFGEGDSRFPGVGPPGTLGDPTRGELGGGRGCPPPRPGGGGDGTICCQPIWRPGQPVCNNNVCRCLASSANISSSFGEINVKDLKEGMMVWTIDGDGNRVLAPIVKLSKVPAPNHKVVDLVLADGRRLQVSAAHPAANGRMVGDLKSGDEYDGSIVASADLTKHEGGYTYDLLPAGDTGYYWANGILMGSTLK